MDRSNRGDPTEQSGNCRVTMRNGTGGWRWRNVPVPEAHVAGLILGATLQLLFPRHVATNPGPLLIAGLTLIGAGMLLGAWAVRTVGPIPMENPSKLVTTGPFGFSRNPMYVAWTVLYMGIGCVINSVWLFVLLPVVAVATHLAVRREERSLARAFGDDYRDYTDDVRRYL